VTQAVNGIKGSKPKLNPPGQREERNRQPDFEWQGSILEKGHATHATAETLGRRVRLFRFMPQFGDIH
jgi:hypothetical protein